MYFLAMNVTHKPFDNKLVRQAFNYAVDPTVVIKHIYEGNGYVMSGPLGANVIGYDPKIKRYPYDPKRAKELLTQAGFANGLEIKLHFSPDRYPKAKEVCQVIADQLARAGVKTELVSQEFAIFWGIGRSQRRQNSFLLRWAAGHRCGYGLRSILSIRKNQAGRLSKRGGRPADRRAAQDRRSKKADRAAAANRSRS